MKRAVLALVPVVGVAAAVFLVVTLTGGDEGHITQAQAEQAVRDFAARGLLDIGRGKQRPTRITKVDCKLDDGQWGCKYDNSGHPGTLDFEDREGGHPETSIIK